MTTLETQVRDLEYVARLTSRRAWAVVCALAIVVAGLAGWATYAPIESTVALDGYLLAGRGPTPVLAPASGTVVAVGATPGQPVTDATEILVVQAAGRRYPVTAPGAGTLARLTVTPGATVARGALVATVEPVAVPLGAVLWLDAANPPPPLGATVRGGPLAGTVQRVEPFAAPQDELARQLGLPPTGQARLVRAVFVALPGHRSWPGASATPVRMDLVVATTHPWHLLLNGGRP